MSMENASKFMTKVYARDRKVLTLIAKGAAAEGLDAEEIEEIAKVAQDAGWDFTADELQEAYLGSLEMTELDEGEFAAVAGGFCDICPDTAQEPHRGGCSTNYYAEECLDTVSDQDGCNCTDWDACADYYHKC